MGGERNSPVDPALGRLMSLARECSEEAFREAGAFVGRISSGDSCLESLARAAYMQGMAAGLYKAAAEHIEQAEASRF